MTATSTRSLLIRTCQGRRRLWLAGSVLLLLCAALGGRAPRPAFAQVPVPPPGPLLGTGDWFDPVSGDDLGIWEAFPASNALNEVLYFWNDTYVSRAYPCVGTGATPACYAWIQYIWYDVTDPYNTSKWIPFDRGCMLLGADPLKVGEADGFSARSDLYVAGDTYVPSTHGYTTEGTLNPSAGGSASVASQTALDPVLPYPCRASGAVGGSTGPGGGTQCSVAGSWTTVQNGSLPVYFNFSQSGTTITGTASAPTTSLPTGTVSGTLIGNQLNVVVTWTSTIQGAYSGTVSPGQITNGSTYQVGTSPSAAVSWNGTGPATCGSGGSGGGGSSGRPSSITGTWDANNGVWTFTQSGSNVTASIVFSGGLGSARLQGTLSNGTVQATWSTVTCTNACASPAHGSVTLTVSSNGCSMQGTYTSVSSVGNSTGPLTMTKRGCS